jgi:hypothetical protein
VPAAVANSKISLSLSLLEELRAEFARDDEADEQERNKLARVIREEPQFYSPEEMDLVERSNRALIDIKENDSQGLASPDHLVRMSWVHPGEGSHVGSGIGFATAVVDASIEDCAAWELSSMSREQTKSHHERKGLGRSLTAANPHCYVYHLVVDLHLPGFQPREWVLRQVWKWDGDSRDRLDTVAENFENPESYPINPKYVRAKAFPHMRYEKLEPIGELPQTRVTYIQGFDLGGFIPKWVVSKGGVNQLMHLSAMRKKFDQSLEIDAANRARTVTMIKNHSDAYSEEENIFVKEGLASFQMFESQSAKDINMDIPATKAKLAFEVGSSNACGWASTVVRASAEEVLAFWHDSLSRAHRAEGDLEKAVDERPNDHSELFYFRIQMPALIKNRDFLSTYIWKYLGRGVYICVASPTESERRPTSGSAHDTEKVAVRGKYPTAMKITRVNASETQLEYVIHPDMGGSFPSFLVNMYIDASLGYVSKVRDYFQSLRESARWDEEDGKAVGEVMVIKSKEEENLKNGETKVDARIREMFERYKGLNEIGTKYEFFQDMMTRVVENKLRPPKDVSTKLCDMTPREGRTTGAGLAMSLASNLTAEAAVDEWVGKYPALKELDRGEIWFRPMINTVAVRLLSKVPWGLKFRVFMGAGLSMLDLGSDVNVIFLFLSDPGTIVYGKILIGMIATCLLLQVLCVYIQNMGRPPKLLKEILFVLTGTKPGVDAMRVSSGKEIEEGNAFDPKTELVMTKGIELFAESIPGKILRCMCASSFCFTSLANPTFIMPTGCVLQCYVLILSKEKTPRAIVSIAISAMTAGFVSASMSFE